MRVYIYLFSEKEELTKKKSLRCQFTEGWVEFLDKKVAKQVALSLNGHMIGGNAFSFECCVKLIMVVYKGRYRKEENKPEHISNSFLNKWM